MIFEKKNEKKSFFLLKRVEKKALFFFFKIKNIEKNHFSFHIQCAILLIFLMKNLSPPM